MIKLRFVAIIERHIVEVGQTSDCRDCDLVGLRRNIGGRRQPARQSALPSGERGA